MLNRGPHLKKIPFLRMGWKTVIEMEKEENIRVDTMDNGSGRVVLLPRWAGDRRAGDFGYLTKRSLELYLSGKEKRNKTIERN